MLVDTASAAEPVLPAHLPTQALRAALEAATGQVN